MSRVTLIAAVLVGVVGCSQEPAPSGGSASAGASAAPAPSAAPTTSVAAPVPSATASAAGPPRQDCPEGSSGEGTFNKPCETKGAARLMEVTWTGKMTDTGPSFRVVNKSKLVILYGKLAVYFYDKAGKQLEVKGAGGKAQPNQPCSGNVFGGVMNPGEKAVITFSCVKKDSVPEGTVSVEAEMQTVGFADSSGKKVEFYWRNAELTPDTRAKAGK